MSDFWKNRKIYLSIVSAGYPWRKLVDEADALGLKEVALFVTGVSEEERKEVYKRLEKSSIKSIPFVHIKSDETPEEIEYLMKKFNSKKFNLHSEQDFPITHDISKYFDKIYIENTGATLIDEEVKKYAGICVDVAHLQSAKDFFKDKYENDIKMIKKYGVGCNHISPYALTRYENFKRTNDKKFLKGTHLLKSLKELDYLKDFPSYIFSDTIALEMTNPLKEQIKAREYIIKLLKNKKD